MARQAGRIPWKAIRAFYIGLGLALMGVRSLCLFTWAVWHLVYPPVDLNGNPVSYLGMCMVGFVGTILMPLLWPLGLVLWIKGPATLGSIYLFPWFALPR